MRHIVPGRELMQSRPAENRFDAVDSSCKPANLTWGAYYMKIKVYAGCAVDGHNGIYTPMIFAERTQYNNPMPFTAEQRDILLAGPEHEEYNEVTSELFPIETGNIVYEYNESGDILTYELIDSDKITLKQLDEHSTSENFGHCMQVYECSYGYADIAQIGENCLCRVSISNTGIIGADCFFEMDDCFSFDENLSTFCEELEETLKNEFEEDHDIFILPGHFASALINADESGLGGEERQLLDDFVKENCKDICTGCSEESFFTANHDLHGIGAANCLEFYFRKAKP